MTNVIMPQMGESVTEGGGSLAMYASTVILTTRAFATLRRFCEHYWAEYPVVLFDDGEASLDFGVEGEFT